VVEFAGVIGSTPECNREFDEVYPLECDYPDSNLKSLIGRYGLNYIVMDHNRLDKSRYRDSYDTTGFTRLFGNRAFTIFQVNS
jgi:hypothetical protein